ncbi:MAG: hypothetical protein IJT03_07120 [Clostridia bacterium]|nr:hypothetical protein [Clostridia bacterium]
MPMILTKTNIEISAEKELELKAAFGKAIETLSGKSENWLMLSFEDNCRLWFKGNNDAPVAFIMVQVYGKIDYSQSSKLTGKLCSLMSESLGIDPQNVYVKYEEVEMWGWNSSNF